jgi:hypothetical protein
MLLFLTNNTRGATGHRTFRLVGLRATYPVPEHLSMTIQLIQLNIFYNKDSGQCYDDEYVSVYLATEGRGLDISS